MSVIGNAAALDTNRAIAILTGAPNAGAFVDAHPILCLPVPVIGELVYGAMNSGRPAENLRAIQALIQRCVVLSADAETANTYATVRMKLKLAGRPIPENDVWIAAICVQHGVPLATADAHFANVEGLHIV